MVEIVSIEGPVELHEGQLMLRIPIDSGGDKLAPYAKGIGEINGNTLNVVIQPWLAEKLRIFAASIVIVDNCNGKLSITRSPKNDMA